MNEQLETQPATAPMPVPIPSDCGICRRAPNCVVFQSFTQAVHAALGDATSKIPGLALKASLTVRCPEFAMTTEVEAQVREQMRDSLRAVPDEGLPEGLPQNTDEGIGEAPEAPDGPEGDPD